MIESARSVSQFTSPMAVRAAWESQEFRVLNLGCGHKTSAHGSVLNVDWSPFLRLRGSRVLSWLAPRLLSGKRREQFLHIPVNVLALDLSRGLPFANSSVDVIYHSHMLEHLPREAAAGFFREIRRVLKPRGFHRMVVPDLAQIAQRYVASYLSIESGSDRDEQHDCAIGDLLEQSVREVPAGFVNLEGWRRRMAMAVFGDARRRGEVHRWMYDFHSLRYLLRLTGFENVSRTRYDHSDIPGWEHLGFDLWSGREEPPDSLYVEARRLD